MRKYDTTTDNGDWPSWRRLVLSELESLRAEVKELQAKQGISATDMAVLKAKIALFVAFATFVVSPFVGWLIRKLGL